MNDFRSMQDMFNGTVDGPIRRQPRPLFLADALDADARSPEIKLQAASELRRLHEAYECNTAIMHARTKRMNELHALNQELLEALNAMLTHMGMDEDEWNKPTFDQARAAIAKAQEQK